MEKKPPLSPYKAISEMTSRTFVAKGQDPEHGFIRFDEQQYTKPLERVEADMVTDTDELIGILDGSITEDSRHFLDGERRFEGPVNGIIWLDKSARPVRALASELWDKLSDQPMPPSSFLNIDKEDYILAMGYSHEDYKERYIDPKELSLDKLSPRFLALQTAQIRALYLEDASQLEAVEQLLLNVENDKRPIEDLAEIWRLPTRLDHKHIGIVDEVGSSRATLSIADKLLQHAFPDTAFEPAFWSTPKTQMYHKIDPKTGEMITKLADSEKPLWYVSDKSSGRGGIENKNPEDSARSENIRQRIGKNVLSISFSKFNQRPDSLGIDYRDDFKTLRQRFIEGKLTYIPARSRDDVQNRIETYYRMPFSEWRTKRPTSRPTQNDEA